MRRERPDEILSRLGGEGLYPQPTRTPNVECLPAKRERPRAAAPGDRLGNPPPTREGQ
jgi:hypothetical protein